MPSGLYKKDTFLDKNIDYLINHTIIEYDLKSANVSLCREYNLLPEKEIEKIANLSKAKRVVAIGKLMRKDLEFNHKLKESFIDIRKRFFEANKIEDQDILSIKKDAVFCLRQVPITEFGACHFVEKNIYTAYMTLNNCEFYYAPRIMDDGILDVKGISDQVLPLHENYTFNDMQTLSKQQVLMKFRKFVDRYKNLKLDIGYYREFNQESVYRLIDSEFTYTDDTFIPYDNKLEHLDIDYNFFNYVVAISKILI